MDAPSKEVVEVYRNMLLQSNKELSTNEQLEEFIAQFKTSSTEENSDKKNNPPISAENIERNKELFQKNAAYNRIQDGRANFENIQLLDLNGEQISEVIFGQEVILRMTVKLHENISFLGMGYHIRNSTGIDLIYTDSRFDGMKAIIDGKRGEIYVIDWKFKVELRQELYDIACVISTPNDETFSDVNICDFVPCALQFSALHADNRMIMTGGYVHWHNDLKITKLD